MLDFFEGKIHHPIIGFVGGQDRWFLGDIRDNRQAVLVVEDGELRIYTYDFDADDECDEEGWYWCGDTFQNFTGYYNENSLGYVKLDTCGSAEEIADELYKSCEQQLNSCWRISRDTIKDFIEKHSDKIKKEDRVYTYYK